MEPLVVDVLVSLEISKGDEEKNNLCERIVDNWRT